MTSRSGGSSRGRGRPRDDSLDSRILEQTIRLLVAHGYAGFTLDQLAARSGVAKTTILRRWPSKAAVAAAGLERLALHSVSVPDTGTLRGDLEEMLHGAVDTFVRGRGRFVPRLIRESGHRPEIADLLATVIHTRRQAYRRILARALARGELSPAVDHELFIDVLIGPVWTRLLITRDPVTREYVDRVVHAALTAFTQPAPTQRPAGPGLHGDGSPPRRAGAEDGQPGRDLPTGR